MTNEKNPGTLYMTWKDTAEEYRMRWIKALDRLEAARQAGRRWKTFGQGLLILAIVQALVFWALIMRVGGPHAIIH